MEPSPVHDPIEILSNKGNREPTYLAPIWNPFVGGLFGFSVALFVNWGVRKPVFSGIQKHIAFSAIGAGLGVVVDNKRSAYVAKRDAVFRHYIELHPEDFPVTNRKKYGEILESWVPIR